MSQREEKQIWERGHESNVLSPAYEAGMVIRATPPLAFWWSDGLDGFSCLEPRMAHRPTKFGSGPWNWTTITGLWGQRGDHAYPPAILVEPKGIEPSIRQCHCRV